MVQKKNEKEKRKKRGMFMKAKRRWKDAVKKLWKGFFMLAVSIFIGTAVFQMPVHAANSEVVQQTQPEGAQIQQEGETDGNSFLTVFMILIVFLVIVVVIVVAVSVSSIGAVMSKQLDD